MADIVAGKKVGLKENFLSLRTALGFAVAVVIIYIFLRNFPLGEALASIATAKWPFLALALAVFYISLPLRGARWGFLLRPAEVEVSTSSLSHYYFLSWFANAVLPARIGDIYRAYLLKKNEDVPISLSFGVIFSERVFDLAITASLVVLSGSYFWGVIKGTDESRYLLWGIVATVSIILMFIAGAFFLPRLTRLAPQAWRPSLERFRGGIFRWPSLLPIAILMTLGVWLTEALRLYLVFLAFDLKVGFLAAVFISQAALILISIPLSPAGLGLVELLMFKLLSSADISLTTAGAVTLSDRLISYWSLVIFGGISYILSPRIR
ncbi:MAG: hypothetical protein A2W25_16090 [candidate division Zixibacteria bacterium RBG_16_53_22]|nr:MAG: hypothetical protein A2W25_16090 [candidate division Zixibacteria bacterium RBG_16_53_22]